MGRQKGEPKDVRRMLEEALGAASGKDTERALRLFGQCIEEYLRRNLPFKAIATARKARSVLGGLPRASALIIGAYRAAGLDGDACQEYERASSLLKKDSLAFFKALDDDAFVDLLSVMDIEAYPKGRTVLDRGDRDTDLFVVLSGSCEVLRGANRLGVMGEGDVFGEIGFFAQTARSATVKAREKSVIARIPSGPLRHIGKRHACLAQALETVYSERILKKAAEDLDGMHDPASLFTVISTRHYAKGQDIPRNPGENVAILKHGIVEVDYQDRNLTLKRYLRPGSLIVNERLRARASTDVVILLASVGKGSFTPGTDDDGS
jgi:hypothetical protein